MELFGTAGIRGDVIDRVTPELALRVGRALALEAAADSPDVVVGRDGRTTGPGLAAAVEAGLSSGGATVSRVGVVPTPALAHASRSRYGVMVTASHNPPGDNGLKCFADGTEYDSDAEATLEERVTAEPSSSPWDEWGSSTHEAILDDYRDAVGSYALDFVETDAQLSAPLEDTRIAVDCGNGTAGLATPQVLADLGATPIALHANVDGHFPARESKPTAESLTDLRSVVSEDETTDFGIGHDGDADRIVIVGPDGDVVPEDTILAILAEQYVRASTAGDPVVVTTPNASGRIDERVSAAGGRTERVALGKLHEGIARERAAGSPETEIVFAGEPWKHVHPAFGGWIDGVVSAAVLALLIEEAGGIGALRDPVTERPSRTVSIPCPDEQKAAAMEQVANTLPEQFPEGDVDAEYGVRIDLPDGSWVLVRPSGTEPYLRCYAESEDVEGLVEPAREIIEQAIEQAE
jgi:phosphomannomutase